MQIIIIKIIFGKIGKNDAIEYAIFSSSAVWASDYRATIGNNIHNTSRVYSKALPTLIHTRLPGEVINLSIKAFHVFTMPH